MTLLPRDRYNEILEGYVRPPGWADPEPAGRYDLLVIGAGTAGLVTAAGAASLGERVALVERNLMGGDCLNFGCVPSKGILRAARAVHDARNASEFGVAGGEGLVFDFPRAMERMRRLRAGIGAHDSAARFRDTLGVDVFLGEGRFTGRDSLSVNGSRLRFRKAAICTGARASVPPVPGLAEAGCLTNETVFSLTALPPRLLVIGAGPVGCEMAQAFARFGSRVTLVARGSGLLPREDLDATRLLHDVFVREGITVCLGSTTESVRRDGNEIIAVIRTAGEMKEVRADAILAGTGRLPNVEGLGLEAAGVDFEPGVGVKVDDRLRTANPGIFAAGDICSRYRFTHAADAQARILIANALFFGRRKASALTIPWCTYTDPEIAHVGMLARDAAEKGSSVTTLTVPLSEVDRAVLDGEAEGFARIHLKKGTDRILGATLVAAHAGEMIGGISLAMTNGLGLSAIGKTIHPYPTQAEAVRKLADAHARNRLTPFVKRLFSAWFGWRTG
jgi:pyruvate/2-oxoglutarate dehydrogenase complex dihydrolipoamide dehydrogenase (E3) component